MELIYHQFLRAFFLLVSIPSFALAYAAYYFSGYATVAVLVFTAWNVVGMYCSTYVKVVKGPDPRERYRIDDEANASTTKDEDLI